MLCKRCKRKLTNGKSLFLGYGLVCYRKHLKELEEEFLKRQITIYEVLENEINHTLQDT